jgi:hypothetical protein
MVSENLNDRPSSLQCRFGRLNWWGKRVGTQFLEANLDVLDYDEIVLDCAANNGRGRRFWEHRGFKEAGAGESLPIEDYGDIEAVRYALNRPSKTAPSSSPSLPPRPSKSESRSSPSGRSLFMFADVRSRSFERSQDSQCPRMRAIVAAKGAGPASPRSSSCQLCG